NPTVLGVHLNREKLVDLSHPSVMFVTPIPCPWKVRYLPEMLGEVFPSCTPQNPATVVHVQDPAGTTIVSPFTAMFACAITSDCEQVAAVQTPFGQAAKAVVGASRRRNTISR